MIDAAARTADEYLEGLPSERRAELEPVLRMLRENMPAGYSESIAFGMIGYGVPLERFPDTYNGQPLAYVGLAAQKNYNSLYLMGVYQDSAEEKKLKEAFARAGKKLDMGKSCIRFKRAQDLPLDDLASLIGGTTPDQLIRQYNLVRQQPRERPARSS